MWIYRLRAHAYHEFHDSFPTLDDSGAAMSGHARRQA